MGRRALSKHARRPIAAGRATPAGQLRPVRGQADRPTPPPARFDPLVHPVAITGHCIIADQIRLPVAWCDMTGCGAVFADPAALGEADNRARAAAAGWRQDRAGQLLCPACQQRHRPAPAQREFRPLPATAGAHTAIDGTARAAGGVSHPVQPMTGRWSLAPGRGRHHGVQGRSRLAAPASDRDATPPLRTIPRPRTSPAPPAGPGPCASPAGHPPLPASRSSTAAPPHGQVTGHGAAAARHARRSFLPGRGPAPMPQRTTPKRHPHSGGRLITFSD
jgi:hypothetical protein